ncbi:MAG: DUF1045 domain-containing protein [Pseudomonadota bacterium]
MDWTRYAIYWLPDGGLGRAGAEWLGWDARAGQAMEAPAPGTDVPRNYGFHATIKPPFRLAEGADSGGVAAAAREAVAALDPVDLGRLTVARPGRFLALVPERNPGALAAEMVAELDRFRAPAAETELARRRANGLTERQEEMLFRWGYPFVMEEFRMHLTLTGRDPRDGVEARARAVFEPLTGPYRIEALSLVGEGSDGRFRLIEDLPLRDGGAT